MPAAGGCRQPRRHRPVHRRQRADPARRRGDQATRRYARLLLFACVLGGLLLVAWRRQPELLAIGGLGVALGWAYSSPPLALMARGLGEPTVSIAWWLVVVGADALVRGHPSPAHVACGAGFAMLVASVLLSTDSRTRAPMPPPAHAARGPGARHATWHSARWCSRRMRWHGGPRASCPTAGHGHRLASLRPRFTRACGCTGTSPTRRLRPAIIAMLAAVPASRWSWAIALATTAIDAGGIVDAPTPSPSIRHAQTALITGATPASAMPPRAVSSLPAGRSSPPAEPGTASPPCAPELGDALHTACFDVRDETALRAALDALPGRFRGIDLLVNNAGLAGAPSPRRTRCCPTGRP